MTEGNFLAKRIIQCFLRVVSVGSCPAGGSLGGLIATGAGKDPW